MPTEPHDEKLKEALAAYAHEAWSRWMKHLFETCGPQVVHGPLPTSPVLNTGCTVISADLTARWQRQMTTPYAELSESEKESDRREAEKITAIMVVWLRRMADEFRQEAERLFKRCGAAKEEDGEES